MTHHHIRRGMAILFLLSQSLYVQATAQAHDAKEVSAPQLVQDLTALLKVLETEKGIHGKKPHADVAKALENVGHAYIKQHNYEQALAYYKKALKMLKALYGKGPHIEIANMLKNVGFAHTNMFGQVTNYKKALKMYKVLYKDQAHMDVTNMLSLIRNIYGKLHQIEERLPYPRKELPHAREALQYAREALDVFKAMHGDNPHLEVASALFNVGYYYRILSDFDNALPNLQQALQMYTALNDNERYEDLASLMKQIGLVCFQTKDFQQAITYFEQSLAMYQSNGDGYVRLGQAQATQNIGDSYIRLKDFSKAISSLKEALNMYQTLFKDQPKPVILSCLLSMGDAYEETNDFDEGLSCYQQALAMCQKLHDVDGASYNSGELIEKIARVYGHMCNRSLQLSYLQKAKNMYQCLGERYAKQMSSYGSTYTFITDANIARVQHDIGMTYCLLGDSKQSLKYFQRASYDYKILYKENKGQKSLLVGQMAALRMMGKVYGGLGKYKKAEACYKQTFKTAYRLKDEQHCAYAYYYLGHFYHSAIRGGCPEKIEKKYIKKAQTSFEEAVRNSNKLKADLWTSYADFLIDTAQYAKAYDCLMHAIDSGDHACTLEYVLEDRASIPPILLHTQIKQENIVGVRAIDYAFYLLIHHYEAFVQAGIAPRQSREAYLATYKRSIEARSSRPGAEKLDSMAKLLVDSL